MEVAVEVSVGGFCLDSGLEWVERRSPLLAAWANEYRIEGAGLWVLYEYRHTHGVKLPLNLTSLLRAAGLGWTE